MSIAIMEKQELISVIIPLHNVEKYLDKCIQSVVEQTYKNLEIILIDDGSTDKCPEICDKWAQKDKRIKVMHKSYGGVADARNAGLAFVSGEYIGFVDSDDYAEKTMYETLYTALKNENTDIAICNFKKVTEDGLVVPVESTIKNEIITGKDALKRITCTGDWYYVTLWNKLYKREIFQGIEFPVGMIYEDEFAAHQIFFQCDKIVSIQEQLYNYVRRNGSIMNSTKGVKCLDKVEAFCERVRFYDKHGMKEDIPRLAGRLKAIYHVQRLALPKIDKANEKKRVREVDAMFKKNYFIYAKKVTLREKIMYTIPNIWFSGYKLKNCLLKKLQCLN